MRKENHLLSSRWPEDDLMATYFSLFQGMLSRKICWDAMQKLLIQISLAKPERIASLHHPMPCYLG